ncbi:MAG: acetyl-CoA carboxylase biotin carboxylase subunit [Desulfotomaculales bacterium]
MLTKILIANRGEIAVRIIRTCRRLGIKTVAIYSEIDAASLHVSLADEAYCLGDEWAYLDIEKIVSVALKSRSEAVHPGYGFLSENAAFSRACLEAGLIFIGPSPEIIGILGDKIRARNAVARLGIPVLPGFPVGNDNAHNLYDTARQIGYPLLVKASAGGGGRGIALVRTPEELPSTIENVALLAKKFFSDGRVYLEQLIPNCSHIEYQILADSYGNVVHLGERDCSIQRRNQKLIEETPSPKLKFWQRREMSKAAVSIVKEFGYTGLGTVEFLVDLLGNFFFIEMNTRLQVEHPVTEMVCGLDLVAEQIRLACGERLGFNQNNVKLTGWAIECRVNAEDPVTFLPCPGKIHRFHSPSGPWVRVDSHVYSGYEVPWAYDSLLGKIITWGKDRKEAVSRMECALGEFSVEGLVTNVPFHLLVMRNRRFLSGEYTTRCARRLFSQLLREGMLEELKAFQFPGRE